MTSPEEDKAALPVEILLEDTSPVGAHSRLWSLPQALLACTVVACLGLARAQEV